jgi:hypothetical protein
MAVKTIGREIDENRREGKGVSGGRSSIVFSSGLIRG